MKRGLFAAGSGTLLGRRMPVGIALELMLTGDLIDAARAFEVGLVNAVAASGNVLPVGLEFAERIAENAPLGLAATKELLRLGVSDPEGWAARLDDWRAIVFTSEDAQEGAAAFVEKRAPVWRGR